jgi:hypothetical protein
LNYIEVEDRCWPSDVQNTSIVKEALDLIRRRELHETPFACDCKFSRQFMTTLVAIMDRDKRRQILKSMSKRLTLTKQKAAIDGGLRDKEIVGSKQHRFRVTRAMRIHYRFSKAGEIEFLEFYDEGHHDDGL